MINCPANIPYNCCVGICFLKRNIVAIVYAAKIANPPNVGIGILFILRLFGLSIAPHLNASFLINGVITADINIVANRQTMISNFSIIAFLSFLITISKLYKCHRIKTRKTKNHTKKRIPNGILFLLHHWVHTRVHWIFVFFW